MKNRLKNQTNPYLLQHANHPVNWYPWCSEAFERAKDENKPIFLSIGYSTCHWCHVMAHESFEDQEIAELLNDNYIAIKVDKEERPDIDSIYMAVCQAFTGSGGWPTSIFMTPEQKPFFAGTYFPKRSVSGRIGFADLLKTISKKWKSNQEELMISAEEVIKHLNNAAVKHKGSIEHELIENAVIFQKQNFDQAHGGFGSAPKFPMSHNLLFLMDYYETNDDKAALDMAEKTLLQMYKGGIFDHIGYGFSRYSTDEYYLVPHFEKMLYDNALLLMSYTRAFHLTNKLIYKEVAEKTAKYILREMTNGDGAFYSAQDADSDGVEGKYYVFEYDEVIRQLGHDVGKEFNAYYDITKAGNFEGKSIPNLLHHQKVEDRYKEYLPQLYEYRKLRTKLHLDDKILTSWNALMISAFAMMYRVFKDETYLRVAEKANQFIEETMWDGNNLSVSFRDGVSSGKGFLDDYAFYTFALINLYEATLDFNYLKNAISFCHKAVSDFSDTKNGGFYLYGKENEQLIITPKETYDGAIPSGNSVMAYNLVKLSHITKDANIDEKAKQQLEFMSSYAKKYPAGYSFFLLALSMYLNPAESIVVVLKDKTGLKDLKEQLRLYSNVKILEKPTDEYRLINDETTYYVCKNRSCLPPTNDLSKVLK